MALPSFRYHPSPLSTGSIIRQEVTCRCCGESKPYVYVGPVYGPEELDSCLCPWCIADGSAHEKLDCEFVDSAGIGGHGTWDKVPIEVVKEVAFRTPGFSGYQQERWWTHCGDAAAFIGTSEDGAVNHYRFRCLHCGEEGGYRDTD
jgi:uncharacterized protein CbrC (UPF0167 family)